MKGNLKNLDDLIGGTVVLMSTGKVGVVRFVMGEIALSGSGNNTHINKARICITLLTSELYATYRSDGISHNGHDYDIEKIISVGDGAEISAADTAREIIRNIR